MKSLKQLLEDIDVASKRSEELKQRQEVSNRLKNSAEKRKEAMEKEREDDDMEDRVTNNVIGSLRGN